jgi:hypothetical protein
MNFKKLMVSGLVSTQLLLGAGLNAAESGQAKLKDVQKQIIRECKKASNCDLTEAKAFNKELERTALAAEASGILKKTITTTTQGLGTIVKSLGKAGMAVESATITTAETTVEVTKTVLNSPFELNAISELQGLGEEQVVVALDLVFEGVRFTVDFTLEVFDTLNQVKPIGFVVRVVSNTIQTLSEGTRVVISAVLNTTPIILLKKGVQAVFNFGPVEHATDFTFSVVSIALDGVWVGAKFIFNGVTTVIGVPVFVLKKIFGFLF